MSSIFYALKTIYDEFITNRSAYCSAATLVTYKNHLNIFFDYLENHYNIPVDILTFDDIGSNNLFNGFVIYLRSIKLCRNVTVRSYCRTLKAFLRYCYENDYCCDYLKGIKLPPDDSSPKIVLYAEDVIKLDSIFDKTSLKGLRNYCIFHLMLDCGLRSQEVRHLKCGHIDRQRNILQIINSKRNKSRITLIPDFVIRSIDDYLSMCSRSTGYVFYSLTSDNPLSPDSVTDLFARLKKDSGINRLHAHLLRHTFATSYLVGGGNLEYLRVFLGHSDYNVTRGYSQLAAECRMLGVNVYRLDSIFFKKGY